ncbi:hypothetical protein BH20CHL6_BH20CHL6_04270 [soil metagenome]
MAVYSTRQGPTRSLTRLLLAGVMAMGALAALPTSPRAAASDSTDPGTYQNPLPLTTSTGEMVESCADPTVIRGQRTQDRPAGTSTDHRFWYMYCTKDPLNDEDTAEGGGFNFRVIPMFRSRDLVHWRYMGDAFTENPSLARDDAGIFAPEIDYIDGKYHLYYTITDVDPESGGTNAEGGGSAIGLATSDGPLGPWTEHPDFVVEPHEAPCCPGSRRNVFDAEVISAEGQRYIYYGSYFGGVAVRELSDDGTTSDPATQSEVAIANKFEGPEVVRRNGFYYLFLSATDCCRGPLTGYSVYVGRSTSPMGPFLDRDGVDLNDDEGANEADPTDGRAGGTPVLSMNGNRWVGPGHNTIFRDRDGQDWTIYHAINRRDPYFEGGVDIFDNGNCGAEGQAEQPCGDLNKRPAMLDPIYWDSAGWPNVRGGRWASDGTMPAPAAQPGQRSDYVARSPWRSRPGELIESMSDEFNGSELGSQWSFIRPPDESTYSVQDGGFRFRTQNADLFVNSNNASVLVEDAPDGDFAVEVRVRLDVPAEGCCFNFRQGGLVIYANDDDFVKLTHTAIFNTRQTEWAKEESPVPDGFPRYGNTVVGPPGEWTTFRIIRTESPAGIEYYQAYSKRDGGRWVRGGTWSHNLTEAEGSVRIGLVSMGGGGPFSDPEAVYTSTFDYVRVYELDVRRPIRLGN